MDPAKSGLNLYAYCKANPLNFVDPYGLKCGGIQNGSEKVQVSITPGGETPDTAKNKADFAFGVKIILKVDAVGNFADGMGVGAVKTIFSLSGDDLLDRAIKLTRDNNILSFGYLVWTRMEYKQRECFLGIPYWKTKHTPWHIYKNGPNGIGGQYEQETDAFKDKNKAAEEELENWEVQITKQISIKR